MIIDYRRLLTAERQTIAAFIVVDILYISRIGVEMPNASTTLITQFQTNIRLIS